jgi:flagellar biogenesis protein FliO
VNAVLLWLAGALLAGSGAWTMWRQRATPPAADGIRLVSNRYLGAKRFLTLVEVDGERLLVGVTGERIALVARLGGAPRAGAPAPGSARAPHDGATLALHEGAARA